MEDRIPVETSAANLTWRVHPARERPGAACFAIAIMLALAAAGAHLMESWGWSVLAMAVLTAALNRFLFPSEFEVGPRGVTARYPLRTLQSAWKEIRRFDYDARGGFLSRQGVRSRWNANSGIPLLFGSHAQAAVAGIRRHLHQEGQTPCAG